MKKTLNIKGKLLDFSVPKVMGVINATPDSFYEKSRFYENQKQLEKKVTQMITDGADIIDIGGHSTRPGAEDISIQEETKRVKPVIQYIAKEFPEITISIDTFRAEVARMAVAEGAGIVNDISGGTLDAQMPKTVAELNVPYVLMHTRGTPQTMQQQAVYENVVTDVLLELQQRVTLFQEKGVRDIIIDPGFGFAKTAEQNFELMQHLEVFEVLEKLLLAGISRKSMIWKTLNVSSEEALNGTTFLNAIALSKGANILRVHDVKEAKEAVILFQMLHKS